MAQKPLKIEKSKRPEILAIVLLLFSLAVILVILYQAKSYLPDESDTVPVLKQGKVGVVDSLYLNFYHYFSWKRPNDNWSLHILFADSVGKRVVEGGAIFPQITWLAEQQHQLAAAKIGLLQWPQKWDAQNAVVDILAEEMQRFETGGEKTKIITPLQSPAHRILQGAFTLAQFPPHAEEKYNLWLIAVLPRDLTGYVIIAQTTEQNYPLVKDDLEALVSGFSPISRTLFD